MPLAFPDLEVEVHQVRGLHALQVGVAQLGVGPRLDMLTARSAAASVVVGHLAQRGNNFVRQLNNLDFGRFCVCVGKRDI
jgi:hypothetical protein